MSRHLSRYLWTAMKDGSRKPAEATRWIKAWGWDGGWRSAWPTDDSMQNFSDNRRSRTTASSGARIRWRARTRAWRAHKAITSSILQGVEYFTGCRKFQFAGHLRTFPDILPRFQVRCRTRGMTGCREMRPLGGGLIFAHLALCCLSGMVGFCLRASWAPGDKVRDGRREAVPGRGYGREVFPRLGSGKCQRGGGQRDGFNAESAESAEDVSFLPDIFVATGAQNPDHAPRRLSQPRRAG